ncbi:hypothetical protein WMY93_031347 [Mugilogobius chulae]|uniref:Uncharacterized protein n=1 Tax=Mugilogobius chulae TaxID=88201 RepID=A0AAW0MGI5_9GOBI
MAESCVHAPLLLLCVLAPCVVTLGTRTGPDWRNVSVTLNPGGPEAPPGGDLLYVRSVGTNDSLHFLFCSQGAPTLLLVQSDRPEARLEVDWPQFLQRNSSGSLRVAPQSSVTYSSALVFSRLFEYDDANDTADPGSDPGSLFPPLDLQSLTWSRLNLSTLSAVLCGATEGRNGSVCVKLSVFDVWGRSDLWPRLLHNPDSAQLTFWLDGLTPSSAHSRFLLELRAVGGAPLETVQSVRSIDDEFTPSIFTVCQWLSNSSGPDPGPGPGPGPSPGFVQWKPVAYRAASAQLEVATPLRHSSPRRQDPVSTATVSGLVQGFYGNDTSTTALNVSFGLSGEPFYTNYLTWTLLAGVGDPPLDSFSVLVWSILAVGLGTPLVLLLVGGAWPTSQSTDRERERGESQRPEGEEPVDRLGGACDLRGRSQRAEGEEPFSRRGGATLLSFFVQSNTEANRNDESGFPEKWFETGGKWLSPVSVSLSLGIGAFLLWKNSQHCREIQELKIQIINNQRNIELERRINHYSDETLRYGYLDIKRIYTVRENRRLLLQMRSLDELEQLGVMWHDSCNSWFPSRDRVQLLEEQMKKIVPSVGVKDGIATLETFLKHRQENPSFSSKNNDITTQVQNWRLELHNDFKKKGFKNVLKL